MSPSPLRTRPEAIAGLVNALVMMLIPTALVVVGGLTGDSGGNAVAYLGTPSEVAAKKIAPLIFLSVGFLPVAAFVGWRTWVHARRYRDGETGGRAVIEAGIVGFVLALLVLAVPTLRNPGQAAPYLIVYGGGCFVVGLLLGCVLWITAAAALHLAPDTPAEDPQLQ